jgi:hypothetical protein
LGCANLATVVPGNAVCTSHLDKKCHATRELVWEV